MRIFKKRQVKYSKNPRARNYCFKNLLAEMCHFKTQKYKNLVSQARSAGDLKHFKQLQRL